MPIGGGNPKKVGDGVVVYVRPDATRGGADLWDVRDALAAFAEDYDALATQFNQLLADYNAATVPSTAASVTRTSLVFIDEAGVNPVE